MSTQGRAESKFIQFGEIQNYFFLLEKFKIMCESPYLFKMGK